jgi:hypothetical protein
MAACAADSGIGLHSLHDVRNSEQLLGIVADSWHG